MTDPKLLFLRELTGLPWPEFLHFLEPDGTITSKRTLDCTRADWERNLEQTKMLAHWVALGIISQATFDFLLAEEEGHS
jgi:hypothetical protein